MLNQLSLYSDSLPVRLGYEKGYSPWHCQSSWVCQAATDVSAISVDSVEILTRTDFEWITVRHGSKTDDSKIDRVDSAVRKT